MALKFECLTLPGGAGYVRRFGSADEFVGGQLALASERLVFRRSPERFEEVAEKRWAALEGLRQYAKAGASFVNGADGPGAVKIGEGIPF